MLAGDRNDPNEGVGHTLVPIRGVLLRVPRLIMAASRVTQGWPLERTAQRDDMAHPQDPTNSSRSTPEEEARLTTDPTDPTTATGTATTTNTMWTTTTTAKPEPVTLAELDEAVAANDALSPAFVHNLRGLSFPGRTQIADVPGEIWIQLFDRAGLLGPVGAGKLVQVSKYFRYLVRDQGFPEAYENDYTYTEDTLVLNCVHAHTAAQLKTAVGVKYVTRYDVNNDDEFIDEKYNDYATMSIAVHPSVRVDPAKLGEMASGAPYRLLLGPGISATGITKGSIHVYDKASVTNISDDSVIVVYNGGKASNITGERGKTFVHAGGLVTKVTNTRIYLYSGAAVTNRVGGEIYDSSPTTPGHWNWREESHYALQ